MRLDALGRTFQINDIFGRLESEQRHMDDAMRQNAKLSTIDKGQQNDRILAEAQQVKLRYLEEVHNAQRKVNDLQSHLKLLESKLADKDAEIRLLQEKKSKFIFTYLTPTSLLETT